MAALAKEIKLVSRLRSLGDRPVRFVYFGGGTPSFLSVRQLQSLFRRLQESIQWDRGRSYIRVRTGNFVGTESARPP